MADTASSPPQTTPLPGDAPAADRTSRSALFIIFLVAIFSAMQFVFMPIWGRVSDRIGRRPILLMGLLSSVVFYALFGVASTFGVEGYRGLGVLLLFVSRIGA